MYNFIKNYKSTKDIYTYQLNKFNKIYNTNVFFFVNRIGVLIFWQWIFSTKSKARSTTRL